MRTKWGNARINNDGYYWITSGKEGYCGKLLHRLLWEDYFGPIPEGYFIHHIDENPINNTLPNLQLMSEHEHKSLHRHTAKLSERQVRSIKLLLRNLTHKGALVEIGKVYGVSSKNISHIKNGKTWKNVSIDR
jgi:hypothetical protein